MGVEVPELNCEWQDITEELNKVSSSLPLGKVIHGSNFSFQESMYAIEMMDPKMDVGLKTQNILSLAQVEAANLLPPISSLSPSNLIYIFDMLISAEHMHYNGVSVGHSLLTCYYLQDVSRLVPYEISSLAHCFISVLLRRCFHIRELLSKSGNYFEEDFLYHDFGFSIGNEFEDSKLFELLSNEIETIDSALISPETCTSSFYKTVPSDILQAFKSRLLWNLSTLRVFHSLQDPSGENLSTASNFLTVSLSYLNDIMKTTSLGQEPDSSTYRIFEQDIFRILLANAPPRMSPWPTIEFVMKSYESTYKQLIEVTRLPTQIKTLREAREAIYNFTSRTPASLIVRSYLVAVIWHEGKLVGKYNVEDVILNDAVAQYGIPNNYASADPKKLSEHMKAAVAPIHEWFVVLSMTKMRTRRRIAHVFENWLTLVYHADVLDQSLSKTCNYSEADRSRYFVRYHLDIIQMMILEYIQLGFELQLYEPYEMPMIWWYIDLVSVHRHQTLVSSLKYMEYMKQVAFNSKKLQRGQNAKKHGQSNVDMKDISITPTWFCVELEARSLLSKALYRYFAALHWAGYLVEPDVGLGSTRTRFFSRFHSILILQQPLPFRFSQFQSSYLDALAKPDVTGALLLALANDTIKKAQAALKELVNFSQPDPGTSSSSGATTPPAALIAEAKQLLRVAVTNGMHIHRMIQDKSLESKTTINEKALQPNLDFSAHKHFPIITLAPKVVNKDKLS